MNLVNHAVRLMEENIFIQRDTVKWSMLTSGINIKTDSRALFNLYMKEILVHGSTHEVFISIQGEKFKATLTNINFNQNNWRSHKDLIQIKYSTSSPLAKKIQTIFSTSYNYYKSKKQQQANRRQVLILPENINEYYVLSATSTPYVFEMDCFTESDTKHLSNFMPNINEETFEHWESDSLPDNMIANLTDPNASIQERERLIKVRKINRFIIEDLKHLYDYRCQITGEKVGEDFGSCVIEAHHLKYFTRSLNNDAKNIIIISPNYHRIIHKNNPHFNFETKRFEFSNGKNLSLKLNLHL